jgi:glycosyltransferase involved in cell wall biosynthesis
MFPPNSVVDASIIIPAKNAAETIGAQLDALSRQHGDVSFEVIVCDNGSRDATKEIAAGYADTVPSLRIIDASSRSGAGAARNMGAATATAAILLFCDADDVVADDWVLRMSRGLDAADVVAGVKEGRLLNGGLRTSVTWAPSAEIRMPYWPRYGAGSSSNLGIRADIFRCVYGFDEALPASEDIDLCWRVQLAGGAFARVRDAVVHSRQRDGIRAVFRQARGYGSGERAMRIKYSRLIEYDRVHDVPPVAESVLGDEVDTALNSAPRPRSQNRLRRLLTRAGLANVAWRIGESVGRRFGGVSEGITPIDATASTGSGPG